MITLQIGDKAPAISLKNQDGKKITLASLKGKKVAVFFYPKDDTPTCTNEACNLRDNYSTLLKHNIEVIGISPDDEKSHTKFISNQKLPYQLLADTALKTLNDYGVWGEKSMFGNKYMGVVRTTFLIDEKGKIAHIITKVKSSDHSNQILKLWKNSL
jgi:thioredoxin-dependent peroxiredoxin